MTAPVLAAARRALAAGLAPWPPAEDGTKRPAPEPIPNSCDHSDCVAVREKAAADGRMAYGWIHRSHTRATESELTSLYRRSLSGLGLMCGAVSAGLEMLEFEGRAVDEGLLEEFEAEAQTAGLGEVLAHIVGGYSERTPSGGIHLLYRCSEVTGNQKLARRPATDDELAVDPDDKVKVLIETRGQGGFTIVAPSNGKVHPNGGAWELLHGGFDSIFELTPDERAALHALAHTFDTMPVTERPTAPPRSATTNAEGRRPGDDFNARASWDDVLEPHGWVLVFQRGGVCYWRRPGKEGRGWSATTNRTGNDTLIVFSSSTPFEEWDGTPGRSAPSYSKFAAYTILYHGGDFEAAARALGEEGYGEPNKRANARQTDASGAPKPSDCAFTSEDAWPALDPVAFHGLAGTVVRTLDPYTEADPAGLLLTFLAFFGSAVGAGPHALADGCVHAQRLFVALVGDTSRSRKGTTSARIRSVFEISDPTWAHDRVMSGFGSGEAIVDEVRDPKMGTDKKTGEPIVIDEGVADKRLLVLEGEFARILAVAAREGSTISAIIRDAWDLGRLAARARQQKSVATGAHVSFVVNITVEELRRRLSEVEMANGLANRYLFGCVRRSKLLPGGGQIELNELQLLGVQVRRALEKARTITRVSRSEAAEKRWAQMYAEMANGPRGLLGAITARAEAQTLRLSVGYALLDGTATVDEDHLEAAYALWKYCEASAAHIFGDALGDDIADRLLAAIRAAGDDGLDFTAQAAVFGRHVKAKRLAAARAELEQLGLIETVAEETDGRPRMVSRAVAQKANQAKEGGPA
jgi:hypothetical protein